MAQLSAKTIEKNQFPLMSKISFFEEPSTGLEILYKVRGCDSIWMDLHDLFSRQYKPIACGGGESRDAQ
jgi:hypothetical protein